MTNYGAELVLTDLINALDRFKHQMELQRQSIAEAAAHQQEAEKELAAVHQELGAERRKLEGLHAELKRVTGRLEEERQARRVA
jgi:small-conductance mechanosensitive channel